MSDLIVIFRTPSPIEADVVRGLLDAHGIPAIVTSDMARTPFPFSLNELRVTVGTEFADQARRVIESHREEVGPARIAPFGSELEPLERRIEYRFRDRGLLEHALTHRSRVHEDASGGVIDNESLEFLGDSVLGFIIADLLFRNFPEHNEGQKSKLKASLVSAASLARLGDRLGLGEFLILGRGEEKTGGRKKLAHIAEATFTEDYKSALQEWLQAHDRGLPVYRLVAESGPPHRRTFEVEVLVAGTGLARAGGRSKKEAAQAAAKLALDRLAADQA